MGYQSARDMREQTKIDVAVVWHLTGNHYPPLPAALAGACLRAIENATDGEWSEPVELPDGMTWRGKSIMTTAEIVEACNLAAFID